MAFLRRIRSKEPEYMYRVEMPVKHTYNFIADEYDSSFNAEVVKVAIAYRTPYGVRLVCGKLVLNDSKRKYADFTEEAAWVNFYARKNSELGHLMRRMKSIENRMKLVKEMQMHAEMELKAIKAANAQASEMSVS